MTLCRSRLRMRKKRTVITRYITSRAFRRSTSYLEFRARDTAGRTVTRPDPDRNSRCDPAWFRDRRRTSKT